MVTKTTLLVAAVALAVIVTAALLLATLTVHNTGTIVTIGLSASIDTIDWGTMAPDTTKQCAFSVKNTGSAQGRLTMTTTNLPNYLVCTWNSENMTLQPQQNVTVAVNLYARTNATQGPFAFDIILTLNATS